MSRIGKEFALNRSHQRSTGQLENIVNNSFVNLGESFPVDLTGIWILVQTSEIRS